MNDKCPKCGAEKTNSIYVETTGGTVKWFACGTVIRSNSQSQSSACQIAALESRVEKLEGMLRKFQYYDGACRCCYTSRGIECLPDCELAQLLKGA